MRNLLRLAATGIAGLMIAGPAWAEVRVTFVDPHTYTDAGLRAPGPVDADAPALVGLRRILERAGERLPPGQDLHIEILDVDLAGHFPPLQVENPKVRVMDATTWPRVRLRYALLQAGRTVADGEETVTDMTYLSRSAAARSTAPLRYEEPMLLDWFAGRFGGAQR